MKKLKNSIIPFITCLFCIGLAISKTTGAQNPKGVITVKSGGVLRIAGGCNLITNSDIDNSGTLINAGTIVLNGVAEQKFPGTGTIALMNVLEVRNTGAGIVLNNAVKIFKELKLTRGNLALSNFDVTIQSTAAQTAAISEMGSGASVSYGTGRFVIERFIKIGSVGHGKSWQLLSVPAIGKTIRECWQESGSLASGFGTQLTHPLGTGGGYDMTTVGTSIKKYVSASGTFDLGPTSTNTLIDNAKGYMLFVRGDRTVASGSGSSPTVLRIRGTIFTPANPPASIGIGNGGFESVGNPYASQIDFTLLTRTGGTDNKFYTWDPWLSGAYGVGAYQTISATNGWVPVPGGGNYSGVKKTIESGQAFFVKSTGASGTIGFLEAAKANGNILVNKDEVSLGGRQFLRTSLLLNSNVLVDGNAAAFDDDLSNTFDGDDALKILNGGENFGLKRENQILSIEGRRALISNDTLFYFMKNMRFQQYKLLIIPKNITHTTKAFFIDKFLATTTPLSVTDSNYINFGITADTFSSRSDRFMVVFKPKAIPVQITVSLQAIVNYDETVSVNWQNKTESMVANYTVEKSIMGTSFLKIASYNAKSNNNSIAAYNLTDPELLRVKTDYRIKIIDDAGYVSYSPSVTVYPSPSESIFKVYPNPVIDKKINLVFNNQLAGKYDMVLSSTTGQVIWKGKVVLKKGAGNVFIDLPKNLAPAVYQLAIIDSMGKSLQYSVAIL